jgi:non-specific serine/threonine protein kinase/serine/threonine-protein kinase
VNAEQWRELRPILESALELNPDGRKDFLDSACQNPSLRREIESLLQAHDGADPRVLSPDVQIPLRLRSGARIGSYEILEEIAEGGMGAVYRAIRADGEYRQQVALKVMHAELGGAAMTARFRSERQILAHLDHPNIARILDGGATPEGLPYFVMEWIDGQPVTNYCDLNKLSVEQRLQLFRAICLAIHYAHQRLIIHRDIKPSNILVAADGIPKLVDFGIAKVLDAGLFPEKEALTTTGIRMMTPEYASPEQFHGQPITTASDTYSLGLVLFELLTGTRAYNFEGRTPYEIARMVTECEPEAPSNAIRRGKGVPRGSPGMTPKTLSRRLEGDLDNIVAKALRKQPEERYQSVEQFADDIRRHLESLPILARKDTARYRTAKFVKRHAMGVATASLVAFLLLAGLAITLYEAGIARAERRVAEQRFNDLRELARSNLFEFSDAIQNLPGSASARHLVIQRALGYLDKLSPNAAGEPGLLRELAEGYERIASLEGNFSGRGVGDSEAALESYRKALAIRNSLVTGPKVAESDLKAEIHLLGDYVFALLETGRASEASVMATRELAAAESVARKLPGDRSAIFDVARAHLHAGSATGGNGSSVSTREIPEAIAHDREAIRLLAQLPMATLSPAEQRSIIRATTLLAFHLNKQRQFVESLKTLDGLVAAEKEIPPEGRYNIHDWRAMVLTRMGDFRAALVDRHKAFDLINPSVQSDPHDLGAEIGAAAEQGSIGWLEAKLGNNTAGKKRLDTAIHRAESLLAGDPRRFYYKDLLLIGYGYQAEILSSMNDQKGAVQKYSQAISTSTDLEENDSRDLESRLSIGKLHLALGVVLARDGQFPNAREELRIALQCLQEILLIRPQDVEALYILNMVRFTTVELQGCTAGQPCRGVVRLRLPNLIN